MNPGLENMIADHFGPALNKIQLLLKGWDKLQISLWRRIQEIKMVIAPKLNYLLNMLPLNMLPLNMPVNIFRTIDNMFSQFIWL